MSRQSMYASAGNSSSSHLSSPFGISFSRSSTPSGSGFFERHNIFARNRPRTTPGNPAASASSTSLRPNSPPTADTTHSTDSRRGVPRSASSAFRQRFAQHSSSSTSQLPLDASSSSPSDSPRGRFGFPSRPSQGLRSPFDEDSEELQDPTHDGPDMPPMTRTSSSGAGGGPGSAFGRMFRRYSQGQTRTLSNATDASAHVGRSAAPEQESSQSRSASAHGGRRASQQAAPTLDNPVSARTDTLPAAIAAAGLLSGEASSERGNVDGVSPSASAVAAPAGTGPSPQAGVHRIRLVPHLEATRSLHFEPIERDVREGASAVKIGRFTDRAPGAAAEEAPFTTGAGGAGSSRGVLGAAPGNRGGAVPTSAGGGGRVDSARIAFKSKVVSRVHAEVWCEPSGKFFIKDTSSSSGTFLNHIRLSAPNVESKPFAIKDGDILQLGVDYQGGAEEIYRCVKIRVELNRAWQREANQFNVNALRQLRALQGSPMSTPAGKGAADAPALPTNRQSMNVTDCCICLFSVTVCQALFIAPCSHVFHYKCIRPMLNMHHPGFSCPLCRTFADLEADVEEDEAWQQALLKEAEAVEASKVQTRTGDSEPPTAAQQSQADNTAVAESASADRAGIPSSSSAPLMMNHLQRQLGDDRPGTAVGEESPHGSTGHYDYVDATMLGNASPEEEAEELIEEQYQGGDRSGSGSRRSHAHDIERISEEADRSGSSDNQSRRGSAPIAISRPDGPNASQSYGFSPLEEARTPVNQHVLSVLAEAPPPAAVAARRIAQADGVRTDSGSSSVSTANPDAMPSLGSSSGILATRPIHSSSLATPGSPNGSAFSDDAAVAAFAASGGYHTPPAADESHEDNYVSASASGTSVRRHSAVTQVSGGAGTAAEGSGHLPPPRRLAGNSGPASSSSNRASPTTAGGDGSDERHGQAADEDGFAHEDGGYSQDDGEDADGESKLYHESSSQDDIAGNLDGPGASRSPSAAGSGLTPKGKSRRRESGSDGVFDHSSSPRRSTSVPRQQDASAMGAGAGGAGKVKMFFKKAAGTS